MSITADILNIVIVIIMVAAIVKREKLLAHIMRVGRRTPQKPFYKKNVSVEYITFFLATIIAVLIFPSVIGLSYSYPIEVRAVLSGIIALLLLALSVAIILEMSKNI